MVPNGWNTSFVRSMVDDNALPGRLISYVTFQSRWKKGKFDGVIPDGQMMQYFQRVGQWIPTHVDIQEFVDAHVKDPYIS